MAGAPVPCAMTSSYRHVALMGPPGVGKTTFIKKVVGRLQEGGLTCQGFYTEEVRQEGSRTGFDVVTLEGQRGILSRVSPEDSVRQGPRVGKYAVDVANFESLALPALHTELSRPAVLVLDEVGKMEMLSDDFVKGVRQAISSPSSTILATIPIPKGKPIPLVEEIRRNHSFLVVHLTRSNRDDPTLQEKIMNILRASLKI